MSYTSTDIKIVGGVSIAVVLVIIFLTNMTAKFIWNYKYIDTGVAEKGLIFKDTLNLNEYRLLGTNNWWGIAKFDKYARSDRHEEIILVRVTDKK